jgi:sialidase-1
VNVLNTLVQPLHGCEGSTLYHQSSRQLFYTGLGGTSVVRTNLSLFTSQDNGENWTFIKTIWPGPSAYSSLTTLNDHSIGVLHEAGNRSDILSYSDSIVFTIIYNETEKKV